MLLKANAMIRKEDMEKMQDKFSDYFKEPCLIIPPQIDIIPSSGLTVLTKQEFTIKEMKAGATKENIEDMWNGINKGYNFIFINEQGAYISVEHLNNMLGEKNG